MGISDRLAPGRDTAGNPALGAEPVIGLQYDVAASGRFGRQGKDRCLAVMLADLRVDYLAADCLERVTGSLLVDHARIAGDICGEDRREAAGCGHSSDNP